MLKLPISLDAIPNNSAIGMKAKLCQWHSLTHNSDTSVVASGSPSNPIAFFGRKDRRRERAKTVSGRLQLLEEINTWQKQKKRERERVPSHWPGSRGGCGSSCHRSLWRRRRPTRAKKKRPGPGREWETQEKKVRGREIREPGIRARPG